MGSLPHTVLATDEPRVDAPLLRAPLSRTSRSIGVVAGDGFRAADYPSEQNADLPGCVHQITSVESVQLLSGRGPALGDLHGDLLHVLLE